MAHKGRPYEFLFERDLSRITHVNRACPKVFNLRIFGAGGSLVNPWNSLVRVYKSDEGTASYDWPGTVVWNVPAQLGIVNDTSWRLTYLLTHEPQEYRWKIEFLKSGSVFAWLDQPPLWGAENVCRFTPAPFTLWHSMNTMQFQHGGFEEATPRRYDGSG